jgi:hypothetical protein
MPDYQNLRRLHFYKVNSKFRWRFVTRFYHWELWFVVWCQEYVLNVACPNIGVLSLCDGQLYQSALMEDFKFCQDSWIWTPRNTYGESMFIHRMSWTIVRFNRSKINMYDVDLANTNPFICVIYKVYYAIWKLLPFVVFIYIATCFILQLLTHEYCGRNSYKPIKGCIRVYTYVQMQWVRKVSVHL